MLERLIVMRSDLLLRANIVRILREAERGRFILEERGSDSKTSPNRYCTLGMFLPVDGVRASLHTWSGSNK